jgi:hypothetical protein
MPALALASIAEISASKGPYFGGVGSPGERRARRPYRSGFILYNMPVYPGAPVNRIRTKNSEQPTPIGGGFSVSSFRFTELRGR